MWIKSSFRTNDGEVIVIDRDSPENLGRRIAISPETKPKRGHGHELQDEYSDKLADDLIVFLNKRDGLS